ncbi:MAG: hypothetical protein ACR2FS_15180 [Phormidesmis sp.]
MVLNLGLLTDQYLAALVSQPGWDLRANLPHWAVLVVPTWADCCYVAKHYCSALSGITMPIYIEYGGRDRHVCQVTQEGEIMSIQIDGLEANRALLDAFHEILGNPDRSMGLVRIADERQITVSGGAGGRFLINKTRQEATRQHRADYWHPEDLLLFNRDWRQTMSIGGDWYEASYRCFDPKAPIEVRGPEFCDNQFITRYRLIEGPNNAMFHLCENLDVVALR